MRLLCAALLEKREQTGNETAVDAASVNRIFASILRQGNSFRSVANEQLGGVNSQQESVLSQQSLSAPSDRLLEESRGVMNHRRIRGSV